MKLKLIAFLSSLLILAGCSAFEKRIALDVSSSEDTVAISKADPPKPLKMNKVVWHVITEENLDDSIEEIKQRQGEFVVFAIIPKAYENLSINMEEIRRYLRQQKANIKYYENYLYKEEDEK